MATNDHSNDNGDVSQPTPSSPPTVALIGLGPSGMFFLHALATRVRNLVESCADAAELEAKLEAARKQSDEATAAATRAPAAATGGNAGSASARKGT